MIFIEKIQNKFVISLISLIIILLIGFGDYISGGEISFSIFYLIPVILIALYRNVKQPLIFVNSLIAAIIWFFADFYVREYSNNLIPVWNAFMRFCIFAIVGLLVFNLKEKHLKLNQINNELLDLNAEKNKFIGIAAHDLRNPIGAIYSFSNLIISDYYGKLDKNVFEMMNYIKELSTSALNLLGDLLDVSKIESGNITISLKLQDYLEFINTHIRLNQMLADRKEIKIKLETLETNITFKFDDKYLSEVINNLLTNAIKFSYPKSEILIKISTTENKHIKTEIIDKGKGIREEEHNKLFQYFQKTSTQPTAGEQSTGLGLAIAKKIVIVHKGSIGVISEIDKGSNFYFELPQQ